MKQTPLAQLAIISAGQGAPKDNEFSKSGTPFVRAGSLEALLSGKNESELELVSTDTAKLRKLKTYPKGTILFAKSGMSATKDRVYVLENPAHVVSHLATLIPKNGAHGDYLRLALKRFPPSSLIKDPAYPAIGLGEIENFEILVPEDFDDQIRIAHLLGKVEGLIAQRKQHLRQLDDLVKSVFLEMFGDPVKNDRQWKTQPFSQVGSFISGGTPSKSRDDYWVGEYPWVSPKDMKTPRIFDSEDHISDKVFDESSLKRIAPGHLLIVVRGMILAHSFPVAINMVDVAINQDMKAIKVNDSLRVDYVFHCLNALKRQILKLITTAGHGTKKFDSDVMKTLLVPVPPPEIQDDFILIADKVEVLKSRYKNGLTDLETLYGALSQQAFKGELDLSRMALAAARIEGEMPMAAAVPTPILAPAIELRETDLLLHALQDRTQRAPLLRFWLEAYRTQLGSAAFSLERFIAAAQTRLAELHPDNDFEWGVSDYESIKIWVVEALAVGALTQAFDDDGNRIELKAVAEQSLA